MKGALRRMWIRLTADRRRFVALCTCVALGLLLWARLIVVSQPPRTAIADPSDGRIAIAADPALRTDALPPAKVNHGAGPADRWRPDNTDGARSGQTAVGSNVRRPIRIELWTTPNHDPFVINPAYFPKFAPIADADKDESKSQVQPVEDSVQIEARFTSELRTLVERLKLEAALGSNFAVISGRKYRVGDLITVSEASRVRGVGFKLMEVKQRSVILECEGRQFELHMAPPGN